MWISLNPLYFIFTLSFGGLFILWLYTYKKLATSQFDLAKKTILENQLKEEQKNEQLFLAQISHELRTPINGVIGMLDALKDTPISPEQHNYITLAHQASSSLLTLVNDLLDFSKIREKKLTLEVIDFNLLDLIQEVLSLLGKLSEQKNIPLRFHEKNALPKIVKGDPTRLKQIFYNLIGNAIKFTEQGCIQLTAQLLTTANNKIQVQFEVIDTGIGIKAEQQQNLFQQFSQANDSIARHYGGTGLGLALCQQLTELMGGNLTLISEYGKGSTFTFSIYLQKSHLSDESAEKITLSTPDKITAAFNALVLVVEDNQVNQVVAVNRLTKLGCSVETALDGQQALDLLKQKKFDLILMDCQMPILNGYQTTEQFRLLEKENSSNKNKHTPIVAMTANVMPTDKQLCLDAGMDDYIAKPIKDAELIRVLQTYTGSSL